MSLASFNVKSKYHSQENGADTGFQFPLKVN